MYNLLVSADKNAWKGKSFNIEISRCLNKDEYTDEELVKKYGNLNSSAIKELKKFPCIFAYEKKCKKDPKFGYIKQVLRGKGSLTISYEIIKLDRFLTHSDIQELAFELGIPNWEMWRTHWALKEIELQDIASAKGIKLPIPNISSKFMKKANKRKDKNRKKTKGPKEWYQKPAGIILLTIIGGVFIVLITNIVGLTSWPNKSQDSLINKDLISPTENYETQSPVNSITPKEIKDIINSAPPLQQAAVASNYEGIKISWSVYLGGGSTSLSDENLYTITMNDEDSNSIIVCDIDLNSYPQLKIIREDQMFTVEGEIHKVNPLWIDLVNCKLLF